MISGTESDHAAHAHESEEDLERKALARVVRAFRNYEADALFEVARWEHNFRQLSPRHQALLHTQPAKFRGARAAVHQNHLFLKALLSAFDDDGSSDHGPVPPHLAVAARACDDAGAGGRQRTAPGDAEKVQYVLKNLIRDWSADGAGERAQSYGRILDELKAFFPDRWPDAPPPRVLFPGAGLGRLCVDAAAAGFAAEGNEFSYFMLLTSSFILNHSACPEQWTLHPWATSSCNQVADADQLRAAAIPDICPGDVVPPGLLSMCAGDFVDVYGTPAMAASFDAIVTCFFLDTAHNVLSYLEVLHHALKPGGVWIHLGPLLWHWAEGGPSELSVELSLSELHRLALLMGFTPRRAEFVDAPYIANPRSMYKTVYQAAFWTMVLDGPRLPDDLDQLLPLLGLSKPPALACGGQQQQGEGQQQQQEGQQQQREGQLQRGLGQQQQQGEGQQQQQQEGQQRQQQAQEQQQERQCQAQHHPQVSEQVLIQLPPSRPPPPPPPPR